jgi:hypothetical protein
LEHGDVRIRLQRFTLDGDVVDGEMEYVVEGQHLVHRFRSKPRSSMPTSTPSASAACAT